VRNRRGRVPMGVRVARLAGRRERGLVDHRVARIAGLQAQPVRARVSSRVGAPSPDGTERQPAAAIRIATR